MFKNDHSINRLIATFTIRRKLAILSNKNQKGMASHQERRFYQIVPPCMQLYSMLKCKNNKIDGSIEGITRG